MVKTAKKENIAVLTNEDDIMKIPSADVIERLKRVDVFARNDLYDVLKESNKTISESIANHMLQQLLNEGYIVRVGRNKYSVSHPDCKVYEYLYSKNAESVAKEISKNHPYLDFRIFELIQLNEFVNHLVAHNVIFVSVESDLGDFVFSSLKSIYPGKVLINPDIDTYHNYVTDNTIVIEKLITEAPKGIEKNWHSRLEKTLVDIISDKWISLAVSEGELGNIYEGAFSKYVIDENTMFRYARRRGAEEKIKGFLMDTNVKLRTV